MRAVRDWREVGAVRGGGWEVADSCPQGMAGSEVAACLQGMRK